MFVIHKTRTGYRVNVNRVTYVEFAERDSAVRFINQMFWVLS